ncbi:MAG: hypothetical protein JO099_16200 [Acidobacteriia bacterium]|nr:hypothetical protein [Terriglobia bacterium]
MADNIPPEPTETLRQILSIMYSTFLQNQALQWALVRKGLLTADDVDREYKILSDVPAVRDFRDRQGVTDSELLAALARQLKSFQGPIQ